MRDRIKIFCHRAATNGPIGELLWSQQAILWVQASQSDVAWPFEAWSANDFVFTSPKLITGIRWWGGYWNGDPAPPTDFIFTFYSNSNCEPDNMVMQCSVPFSECHEELFVAWLPNYFSYWANITPFSINNVPAHYWLTIQAKLNFPPQWGWCYSQFEGDILECISLLKFPLAGYPDWVNQQNYDLGFELYGANKIPLNNWALGIGIFLIAVVSLIRMRRFV